MFGCLEHRFSDVVFFTNYSNEGQDDKLKLEPCYIIPYLISYSAKFRRFLVLKYDCCERSNAKHGSKLARISVDFELLEVKSD